jgi:hypothetical protein
VREIRTLRATGGRLETELWNGLRHRHDAKAAGNHRASPRLYQAKSSTATVAGAFRPFLPTDPLVTEWHSQGTCYPRQS